MAEYEQTYSEDEISSIKYEHYENNNLYNYFKSDKYLKSIDLKDENYTIYDDNQDLHKEIINVFNSNDFNKKEENSKIYESVYFIQENHQLKDDEEKIQMYNDYYHYDYKKEEEKEAEKEKEKSKEGPKSEIKVNKINIKEVKEKESTKFINQKTKRENEINHRLQKKNDKIGINTNNGTIKNKVFIVKKTNTSESFKYIIFQHIDDTIKKNKEGSEFSKEKYNIKFKDEMNKKLKDVLNPYANKLSFDKMKKEEKKYLEFFSTSKYIKKLLNKKKLTNKKGKLTKPELKQILRIFNAIKEHKKQKKKRKRINEQKNNIDMINKDPVGLNEEKLFDNNFLDEYSYDSYDSYDLSNFNSDIFGNKEKENQIVQKNQKEKISTNNESNTGSNKTNKSEYIKEGKKFRNDHLINILKNITIHQFETKFNLLNESYKLKIINDKKNINKNLTNNIDGTKEDDIKDIQDNNNEEEDNDGDKKEEYNNEKNNFEEEGRKEGKIIIYITIKNNNNIRKDLNFFQTNYEEIINDAKKRQNLVDLKESEEAKNLILKVKCAFLKEIMSDKNLCENLFEKIKKDKENLLKTDICRNITYEIFKRKDLDGLVNILFFSEKIRNQNIYFKDKDSFINEMKKLEGYEELISNYKDINDDVQRYMISLKEMADNIIDYLKGKKEIIEEKKNKLNK